MKRRQVLKHLLAGLTLVVGTGALSQQVEAQQQNQPQLTLTVTPDTFAENGGPAAATGTVMRTNAATNQALVVTLTSTDTSEARVPATVTIPAGATAASFAVAAVMDNVVDGTRLLHIEATAPGFVKGRAQVQVTDVTPPALRVRIRNNVVNEPGAVGTRATVTGTVARNTILDAKTNPLTVNLQSTNTAAATVPATVTIPVGATSVDFPITVLGDAKVGGTERFQIVATAPGFGEARASLAARDSDVATLTLKVSPNTFSETAGANASTGTVTRNTATNQALVVTLTSTDTSEARVPATVTIPAGQSAVTFPISAVVNKATKGNKPVHIRATAQGFKEGQILVTVTP